MCARHAWVQPEADKCNAQLSFLGRNTDIAREGKAETCAYGRPVDSWVEMKGKKSECCAALPPAFICLALLTSNDRDWQSAHAEKAVIELAHNWSVVRGRVMVPAMTIWCRMVV